MTSAAICHLTASNGSLISPISPSSTQMNMILDQDITMHLHPVALCALSQMAQKLRPISIIPENLFPSISARHHVVDRTGKLNPWRS